MLIGQWREYFFLILLREEGKITRATRAISATSENTRDINP